MTNDIKRKFSTMLPLDVVKKLLVLARETSKTGFGKMDYGVALRVLFERAEKNNDIEKILNKIELLEKYLTMEKGGIKK